MIYSFIIEKHITEKSKKESIFPVCAISNSIENLIKKGLHVVVLLNFLYLPSR